MMTNIDSHLNSILIQDKERFHDHTDVMIGEVFMQIAQGHLTPGQILLLTQTDGTIITSMPENKRDVDSNFHSQKIDIDHDALNLNDMEIKTLSGYPFNIQLTRSALLFSKHYFLYLLTVNTPNDEAIKSLEIVSLTLKEQIAIFEKFDSTNHKIIHALDSVEDAITFCDKDGYLLFANNKCCEILNVPRQKLIGRKVDYLTNIKPILIQVLESKKKILDAEYFMKYNDQSFHLTTSAYPVYGSENEIIGAIDIFQTIERTRKLASSIAGYQAFFTFDHIIGHSEIMQKTKKAAQIFAKYNENILITGESGTGKELFAQSIHNFSSRIEMPFIAINCANFPNELIDSELFGYEEGAFTGALKGGKQGKFEVANGGTLFLDEIGEMQFHLQAKLLRVLETMTINRIGSNKPIQIDVRIIAATNQNLEDLVNEGKFRKDLYYRLKVLYLETPSLKARREDIPLLAEHFISNTALKADKTVLGLTPKAQEMLISHDWAGNVRELENTMSRSVYICEGDWITEDTLSHSGMSPKHSGTVYARKNVLLSKELIEDTYKATGGNKKRTAEILSVSRPTLYKLLKKYNIE